MNSPIENENYSLAMVISMIVEVTNAAIGAGETTLTLLNVPINVVYISASAAETIDTISAGSSSYLILIIAQDGNVTIQDNAQIDLNSLPDGTGFSMRTLDTLALIRTTTGYQELFRTEKN